MFFARHERPARRSTLARRYDFHFGEAVRATLEGSPDKAAGHSGKALLISRELCADAAGQARHQPELAAALCVHAPYGGSAWQSMALLTEAAGRYAALAAADPAAYEVPRIDVLTRIALAAEAAGDRPGATGLLREVTGLYERAPAADRAERDLGLARARFHLGRCLLGSGQAADGLADLAAGLDLADGVLARLPVRPPAARWLVDGPRYLQLAALDWLAAAVSGMTLQAAAGRWGQAAAAAQAAVTVSGGLAELGGDALRETHAAVSARARAILAEESEAPRARGR
jgi:hypothetical protein